MANYPFDGALIPLVLADPRFIEYGTWHGEDRGLHYCVIDPRRHNVDVWQKQRVLQGGFLARLSLTVRYLQAFRHYRNTAESSSGEWLTNGPMMSPPPDVLAPWHLRAAASLFPRFALLPPLMMQNMDVTMRWRPMRSVVHQSKEIDAGLGSPGGGGYFLRWGQGRFGYYAIAATPMPEVAYAIEGIDGLSLIVQNGGVLNTPEHRHIQDRSGVAIWALVPIHPVIDTTGWETRQPYKASSDDEDNSGWLDGVIVSAVSSRGAWNTSIASSLVGIGASSAAAMDPSDSVLLCRFGKIEVDCADKKDAVQEYGFRLN